MKLELNKYEVQEMIKAQLPKLLLTPSMFDQNNFTFEISYDGTFIIHLTRKEDYNATS